MVDKVVCELCGKETKFPITKEFDGKVVNFCCHGCLGVYELDREEKLLNQLPVEQETKKNSLDDKE